MTNGLGIMTMKKQKNKYKNSKSDKLCIVVLCAPAILHLLIFWLGTQIETFRMMFTDALSGEFTFENFTWAYEELFAGAATSNIALAFKNTMLFFVMNCALIPVTMFFAYLIFRKSIGSAFSRMALYLPGAVSGITMSLIYAKIMESTGPLLQAIQSMAGMEEAIVFRSEHGVLYVMIYDILVGVGVNLILWIGGMNRIPYDLIEYGKIEGIGPFQEFKSVILPLIWPTFVTMITLQIINIFGSTGSILVLTNGEFGTYTLAFWMYKMVQENIVGEYNHVAALGMIFTIITIPIVILGRKFMNRFGEEVEY